MNCRTREMSATFKTRVGRARSGNRGRGPQARTPYNRKVSAKIDAEIVFSCRAPTVQTARQVTQISNRQTEILQTPN